MNRTRKPRNGDFVQRQEFYGSLSVLSATRMPPSEPSDGQVGFQGMRLGAASGRYDTVNRDYEPVLGRWMEQGPAGYVDGASLYQFVDTSPAGTVDPSGDVASTQPSTAHAPNSGTGPSTQPTTAPSIGVAIVPKRPILGASGNYTWSVNWQLDKPAPVSGWIVQRIVCKIVRTSPGPTVLLDYTLWEAWPVEQGETKASGFIMRNKDPNKPWSIAKSNDQNYVAFDTFGWPGDTPPTCGTIDVEGSAAFYAGYALPGSFIFDNPRTRFAHRLPSDDKDPNLPVPSTGVVDHVFKAHWDNDGNTIVDETKPSAK